MSQRIWTPNCVFLWPQILQHLRSNLEDRIYESCIVKEMFLGFGVCGNREWQMFWEWIIESLHWILLFVWSFILIDEKLIPYS